MTFPSPTLPMSEPQPLGAQLIEECPNLSPTAALAILRLFRDWLNDECHWSAALAIDREALRAESALIKSRR